MMLKANRNDNPNPFEPTPVNAAPFQLSAPKFKTLSALRSYGAMSRSHIAEAIGYSPAKITSVVNELLASQMLLEKASSKASGGRRSRELSFNPDFGYIVAATIGTSKLDIALVDFNAHIRLRRMLPINVRDGAGSILLMISDFIQERIAQLNIPNSKILAFGLTVPGPVDVQHGTLFDTPLMAGWGGYPLAPLIRESFPYAVVTVEKDANAMAFAELRKSPGHNSRHFLYLKLGRTLSAGIITQGGIYHGANGAAGELGQIYVSLENGNSLPLDSVASGLGIAAQARAALQTQPDSLLSRYPQPGPREVGIAAAEGDSTASDIVQRTGRAIGEALANLVNFLDPDLILIGGGLSQLGHPLLAAIRRSILDRSPAPAAQGLRIEIAPLGSEASILGASALALESIFQMESS